MLKLCHRPFPVVISAPSGTGKTTVCRELAQIDPKLRYSVSVTTRPPREAEVDGRDYKFVSESEFKRMIELKGFLEYTKIFDHYYGTPLKPFTEWLSSGYDVILDLDPQGNRSIKAQYPNALGIFLIPPSISELQRRLERRGRLPEPELSARLEEAQRDLERWHEFDYLVVNQDLKTTIETVLGIVKAERLKASRLVEEGR